ncbi:Ig-like domain repeat protein [Nocardioides mangrovi]|uniref:Ig-like domain repeat protein n=1 Tax=Nocardioides mangrovi TaxID=2874580 RepID=A0ABS7UFX4_9ACTN|nr:Ig-like domain repeat protein [Nocardioides mangrovi]MBZ5739725.1 Ig-like domain repeat protein [Nocardioides mangrovi]
MLVRKTLAGVLATTVVGAALTLTAGSASAVAYSPGPEDSKTSGITTTDLIGVGSDTSEHALKLLADAWNQGARDDYGQTFDVDTFGALGANKTTGDDLPAPITVDSTGAALARPNGSGPGRATLYGTGKVSAVDFARSSGSPSAADFTNGMRVIPFALDTIVVAVGKSNPVAASNPTMTLAQLQGIYVTCTITNWNQVNASYPNQPIEPFVPKSGSGTESFFKSKVLPTGTTSYGACVKDHTSDADPTGSAVQEHDPAIFTAKPNALVPFSKGRAAIAGTVTAVTGSEVEFKRNLYNVVRQEDANRADIQAFFGENGFVCSAAAQDLIKAAGFDQLATSSLGGDCGSVLNAASSNFTLNSVTTPEVSLTGAGSPSAYNLTATLTSTPAAVGSVTFTEGDTVLAADVPIVSGRAVTSPLALGAGSHDVTATFTPGQSNFAGAEDTETLVIKASSKVKESFPATVAKGKKAKGTVTVKADGATATGTVKIKKGSKTLASGKLKGGKVTITLPALKKGKNSLKVVYGGSSTVNGASKSFSIKQK